MSQSQLLTNYYNAMNKHNMNDILLYIDDNIHVTFPEIERNWNGINNVIIKFGLMFERMPSFESFYEITNIEVFKDIETKETINETNNKNNNANENVSQLQTQLHTDVSTSTAAPTPTPGSIQIIHTNCRFTCKATNSDSKRSMIYKIHNNKIIEIQHL